MTHATCTTSTNISVCVWLYLSTPFHTHTYTRKIHCLYTFTHFFQHCYVFALPQPIALSLQRTGVCVCMCLCLACRCNSARMSFVPSMNRHRTIFIKYLLHFMYYACCCWLFVFPHIVFIGVFVFGFFYIHALCQHSSVDIWWAFRVTHAFTFFVFVCYLRDTQTHIRTHMY